MKPRTKLHHRVVELAAKLPAPSNEQRVWAFENCLKHIGYRTKKNIISCLSCGHVFKGMQILPTWDCPCCARKLTIEDTRKKKHQQQKIMAFIGVQGEFQVNRYFELNCYQRAGEAPSFSVYEITQQWMTEDGKVTVFGRQRNWTYYHDTFTGGMEIRNWDPRTGKYDLLPYKVYPKIKVLPIFKRNGFKRSFYKLTPYEMFLSILRDNRSETLLKANQPDLLNMRVGNQRGRVDRHWDSIKIAIRNGYKVKDAATWLDHLDLLQRFGKDLRNPKYVCSINLALDHRRMIRKREREDRRLALERKKKQIEQEQLEYVQNKGVFFDLVLSAGDITVKVLTSVKEFIEEADRFHHCVYANSYYKKPNSLIFSARVKGRPVETVEVDLGALKVIQSRGVHNRASAYNQQIVNLVNSNIHQIRKRLRKLEQTA